MESKIQAEIKMYSNKGLAPVSFIKIESLQKYIENFETISRCFLKVSLIICI